MNDQIENTLRSHYGVTECVVSRREDNHTIEVYCVGGDVDYLKMALAKLCEVSEDRVNLIESVNGKQLFAVDVN